MNKNTEREGASRDEQTGLAQRLFTKEQADFAAKVANDIHEGIDCYESRDDLRMAVSYWSCVATDANNARIGRDSQAVIDAIKTLRESLTSSDNSTPKVAGENNKPSPPALLQADTEKDLVGETLNTREQTPRGD